MRAVATLHRGCMVRSTPAGVLCVCWWIGVGGRHSPGPPPTSSWVTSQMWSFPPFLSLQAGPTAQYAIHAARLSIQTGVTEQQELSGSSGTPASAARGVGTETRGQQ